MTGSKPVKKRLSSKFKWRLGLLTAMLTLFCLSLIYLARQIEPVVSRRLKETITNATDSLYSITFSDIRINPFTGSIWISDIEFKPQARVYQQLKSQGLNPTHLFDISVKSLVLKKTHPITAYFKKDLSVNELIITRPSIRVYYQHPRREGTELPDKRTAWQRLSKYLHSIHIYETSLNNIDFKYIDQSLNKPEIEGVKNLSIKISDLLIDSLSHTDRSRFYFAKDISVQVKNHEYLTRDSNYRVLFDELNISSSRRNASVQGLHLIPLFKEQNYLPDGKSHRNRYDLMLGSVQLNAIDFKRLIDRRELRASSLVLRKADFNIFLNRSVKRPDFDRGINFPHLALRRFRLNTAIDTMSVQDCQVSYREYNPITERTGRFFINSIAGRILNVCNDSLLLTKKKRAASHFTALLFGKAKLSLDINFDLTSPNANYSYSGKITEANARHFNLLTRPLALLRIKSGLIKEASFSAKANYRESSGTLKMIYNDLSIGVLKMGENNIIQKHLLLSLVANNLLIKEDNPAAGERPRISAMHFYRPDSVSFFGTIWKTLYSGVKQTIGLTSEREKELKKQFENLRPDASKEKKREVRRIKRIDRREERENS